MPIVISIIVPVYNVENNIDKTLKSLIRQTFRNFEIILVNDGSTDGSSIICEHYSRSYSNINYIKQNNMGVSAARNTGINAAKGDYLTFVDGDDIVSDGMLATMMRSVDDCDCVVCNLCYNEKELGLGTKKEMKYDSESALRILQRNGRISYSACAKLFKTSLCKEIRFNTSTGILEDYLFVCEYFLSCSSIAYANINVYCYISREGSAMHSAFSLKRMELVYSYLKSIDMVSLKYPSVVPYIRCSFVLELIEMISLVESKQYIDIIDQLNQLIHDNIELDIKGSYKQRIKLALYRFNPKLYYRLMSAIRHGTIQLSRSRDSE